MKLTSGFTDFYRILSVPYGASEDQVKKKFRELVKKFHPDNQRTGNVNAFREIMAAWQTLANAPSRAKYDQEFLRKFYPKKFEVIIPAERIVFPGSISILARKGLLRKGLRNRDRLKFTGINYDFVVLVKKDETGKKIRANIPLTVRIVCPVCHGSDIYCGSCGGKGNYKGFRFLKVFFEPEMVESGRIYEFELSRFRPDQFVHFKKKMIKVKIKIF